MTLVNSDAAMINFKCLFIIQIAWVPISLTLITYSVYPKLNNVHAIKVVCLYKCIVLKTLVRNVLASITEKQTNTQHIFKDKCLGALSKV